MTEVNAEGGEVIQTDLPAEAVADLQASQEPEKQPEADPQQLEQTDKPAEEPKAEEPKEDPKPEPSRNPETGKFTRKSGPIADLLEKKHEAESRAATAEAKAAELEAKLQQLSTQAPSVQTDDKIKALAEKHGLDPEVLADIVATARDGLSPQLPKEVQDLLQERQVEKQQQEEQAAFNKRADSLASTLKDDLLKDPSVREKLFKLAYSTDKAPDGEPYYQKELAELYFGFIKPEVEPGRVSAETPTGGKSGSEILDFEQIHGDEAKLEEFAKTASSEQWASYTKWRDEKQGDVPVRRKSI
jgi:hypothetical protein